MEALRREEPLHGLWADVSGELLLGIEKVDLDMAEALLEDRDEADAAVDGVAEARLGLVGEGLDGVIALGGSELVEELADVAGAEDAVDAGEALWVVRWEVRRENALLRALPTQELARRAR